MVYLLVDVKQIEKVPLCHNNTGSRKWLKAYKLVVIEKRGFFFLMTLELRYNNLLFSVE